MKFQIAHLGMTQIEGYLEYQRHLALCSCDYVYERYFFFFFLINAINWKQLHLKSDYLLLGFKFSKWSRVWTRIIILHNPIEIHIKRNWHSYFQNRIQCILEPPDIKFPENVIFPPQTKRFLYNCILNFGIEIFFIMESNSASFGNLAI